MALPGIDLPLEQTSELPIEGAAGNWHKRAIPLTIRERVMLDLMAALKNKPDWEKKIFDKDIVRKWRAEALALGDSWRARDKSQTGEVQGLAPTTASRQRVVSKAMFKYVSGADREQEGYADNVSVCQRVAFSGTGIYAKMLYRSLRRKHSGVHLRHDCEQRH